MRPIMRPIERTAFTLDEAAVSSAIGREKEDKDETENLES